MHRYFAPAYMSLRTQRLTERPQDFRAVPTERWPRVWTGLYELGYEDGVGTLMVNVDGSTSLYGSGGGGFIGLQSIPAVAEAGAAFLDALERDMDLLKEAAGLPPVPEPMTIQIAAVTFDGLRTALIDRTAESPVAHLLAGLNAAGQELLTQARVSQSS